MTECECLILGPEGVGKTLLLKKLRKSSMLTRSTPSNEVPSLSNTHLTEGIMHTVPTAGTNIERIQFAKGVVCTLRECGPIIAPLWSSYYSHSNMVVFVVDMTNKTQVSAATMLLLDVLSAKELESKPVLIFFNKTDCELKMSITELKSIMRLDDLTSHASQSLTVVEGSCKTEEELGMISKWIMQNSVRVLSRQ